MKRTFRFLLRAAGVFFLALLAAAALAPLLLRRYLPPERVRALIADQARKTLHREVRFGEVSYGLWQGVTLSGLAVSEPPDFGAGVFASVSSFHARLRWRPLLDKKIVLDTVAADGLAVNVVQRGAAYNFSDLLSTEPAAGLAPALDLDIRKAVLRDAALVYRDTASGDQWRLSGIQAKLGHFRLSGPFDAELALKAEGRTGGKPMAADFSYNGRIDLAGQAEIKKLVVSSSGLRLQASGKISDFTAPKMDLAFSADAGGLPVTEGSFLGRLVSGRLSGEFSARTSGVTAATAEALAILGFPKGLTLPGFKAVGRFDYGGGQTTVSGLRLDGGWGDVEASGLAAGPGSPDLDFSGQLSLPAFSARDVPWARLAAGLSFPALALSAQGHLKGDDLTLGALHIAARQGTVDLSGSVQRLSSGKPFLDLDVAANLNLPEIHSENVAWARLPAGYVSPAMAVAGKVRLKGDDLAIAALSVKAKAGRTDINGIIRGLTSSAPRPDLNVQAKLNLPALKSADIPLKSIPAGLMLPATQWDLDASATMDELKIRRLRLRAGRNDIEVAAGHVSGLRTPTPLFSLLFKCRSFDLGELTQFSQDTRDAGLSGSGFFAMEVSGRWPKPVLAGKMKFSGLGGLAAGLKLSNFTGTASFDERRIDVPNLTGKLEDGTLDMNLTVKNYTASPAIDLEASLDRFDLGKFLAAKAVVDARSAPASAAASPAVALAAKGKLTVGKLLHPSAQANDVRLYWDLDGLTPDLRRLGGSASFKVAGGGKFSNLGSMATQSKLVKVLIFPLMIFQKIGRVGGIKLFPDFNNVAFSDMGGDYAFQNGMMTLRDSHVVSDAGTVSAQGSINLPDSALDLAVTAQVASVAPIGVTVKGSFDNPKTHVELAKFLFEKRQDPPPGAVAPIPASP